MDYTDRFIVEKYCKAKEEWEDERKWNVEGGREGTRGREEKKVCWKVRWGFRFRIFWTSREGACCACHCSSSIFDRSFSLSNTKTEAQRLGFFFFFFFFCLCLSSLHQHHPLQPLFSLSLSSPFLFLLLKIYFFFFILIGPFSHLPVRGSHFVLIFWIFLEKKKKEI